MIKILWPDGPRMVTEDWVISAAQDSWWNNAPSYKCRDCGQDSTVDNGCPHDNMDPVYDDDCPRPETLDDAIEWLSDLGEVTFSTDPDNLYDDQMDGDHGSALASAGLGTDEDYGCFDGDSDFNTCLGDE